jgi:Zn-dependent protease with chaperone function
MWRILSQPPVIPSSPIVHLFISMQKSTLTARLLALTLALLIAVPPALLAQGTQPELPDPGQVAGVTNEQQVQVGLQAMAEVYKQMPVLPDSHPLTQYVQQLGKKLEGVIPKEHSWPYQFHVIQQKEINAFALPGGPIFVNVGTITAADNEAELAGVIGHEMSHVYMQHSVKQATKQSTAQGLLGVLGAVLGGGTAGSLARLGIQIGAGTLFLKYSRSDEAQADAVGAIILYKAGYDPRALPQFFHKLEQEGGGRGPQFLSDHPNPGNRVAAVDKEIRNWPPKNFQTNSPNFVAAKQQANQVKAYTAEEIAAGAKQGTWARQNKEQGSIPANLPPAPSDQPGQGGSGGAGQIANVSMQQVKPSGNFKQLQQGPVSMSYPDNWQVFTDPNAGITIAPPAATAQGAIAYGVSISGFQGQQNAVSLDQALQDLVQGLAQANPGLRTTGSPKKVNVNGVEGRSVELTGTSPLQQNGKALPERDWLVLVPRSDGSFVYTVFVAPEKDFSKLRPTYERMLKSLQVS